MTLLKVLADGTIYPPLRLNDLVIRLDNGNVEIGQFNLINFIKLNITYLDKPTNHDEIAERTKNFIIDEMPFLFEKKHKVYILCPSTIATTAIW